MQRICSFSIQQNNYSVKIPTNRELIAIEALKTQLSSNSYRALMRVDTVTSVHALDLIDMVSYLTILCPALTKDLKVSSLLDLDILDTLDILETYRAQVAPWVESWQKLIRASLNSEPKEVGNEGDK